MKTIKNFEAIRATLLILALSAATVGVASDVHSQTFTTPGAPETEVKNDVGNPLPVSIDGDGPADVRVVPRTRSYALIVEAETDGELDGVADVEIPFNSHVVGVTFEAGATISSFCKATLSYADSAVRPGGANTNQISRAAILFNGVQSNTGMYQSQYVPVPNMFVGANVDLILDVQGEFSQYCDMKALIQLVPADAGIVPG